jgi:hypothetical protein
MINVEIYTNRLASTCRKIGTQPLIIIHLEETFANLKHFNIKLNPKKCTFGIPWCKLLGYIITQCGIEVNYDKISAIPKIGQVRNVKDVQ